ncbi:hypothetical protein [Thalassotalea euphylliae]|uniref:Uncharacterized protein n=1 Tax=Thalassotalea euphylliae TaxID=1655234 RepID=A0A3E0UDP5_9GAMM|nr:hypothetical protein [Thalassotalea euphylliae]REL34687.1 hypothetical protein DXX92_04570 [Thalassotalea euphylliae]
MSDWEFLHDMQNEGYSADQIADAAACGYNPWEWQPFDEGDLPTADFEIDPEIQFIFEDLVESAQAYHDLTGRYLQIWGELGELYAEVKFGIKRHKPHVQGSDGKIGNDFVEIKTISPEKSGEQVQVKRAGNFNKLLVVKITDNFEFEGRIIRRKNLTKGEGKHAKVSWSALPDENER